MSAAVPVPSARRTSRAWRGYLRRPGVVPGLVLVGIWTLCAVLGERLAPFDPLAVDLAAQLQPPSAMHWLGTDPLGRDVLSRVIAGSRDILTVSVGAAFLGTLAGTLIGALIGYLGGWVDELVSRFTEAVVAVPGVILALVILAAVGPSTGTLVLVVAFGHCWIVARTVRAAVLRLRDLDYVKAAVLRGETTAQVLTREIVPNVLPVTVVEFTTRIAYAVFSVASLSFLGFGMQPPSPDWGLQVAENYGLLSAGYWWPTLFPAVAIMSLVIGVYLLTADVSESPARTAAGTGSAARRRFLRGRTPWPVR